MKTRKKSTRLVLFLAVFIVASAIGITSTALSAFTDINSPWRFWESEQVKLEKAAKKTAQCKKDKAAGLALLEIYDSRGDVFLTEESTSMDLKDLKEAVSFLEKANQCPESNVAKEYEKAKRNHESIKTLHQVLSLMNKRP